MTDKPIHTQICNRILCGGRAPPLNLPGSKVDGNARELGEVGGSVGAATVAGESPFILQLAGRRFLENSDLTHHRRNGMAG